MTIEIISKSDILALEEKIDRLACSIEENANINTRVFATKQLAALLSVSTKTISTWRENKLIEYSKVNNTILYTEKAVQDFLLAHTIKSKTSIVNRLKVSSYGKGK